MLRIFPHFPSFTPRSRRAWGFTLLELMTVVILIGILAMIAIPAAAGAMRERRSSRAAHEIAILFNQARARAVARGSAVLVRYDHTKNGFEVREAIAGGVGAGVGNCALAPASSCTVPDTRWNTASAENQLLTTFFPLGTSTYDLVDIEFTEHTATASTPEQQADLCMTPGGRVFYRPSNASATAFQPMTGNHSFRVWMHPPGTPGEVIGIERLVFILPNGTARVGI